MPSGYAPDAIKACFNAIHDAIPSAINAGIYGNKPGYHNCRNQLPSSDYSVQRPDDKAGDGWAGSALDVTMYDPALMKKVTQRLIDATKAGDKRIWNLREFFGTVDGVNVTGMDVRDKRWVTSDPSHLWHVHLSFYRKYNTNKESCLNIAEVFTGSKGAEDLTKDETIDLINQAINSYHWGGNHGPFTQKAYAWVKDENNGVADRLTKLEDKPDYKKMIDDAFNSYHWGGDHGVWKDADKGWINNANNGVSDRLMRLEGKA